MINLVKNNPLLSINFHLQLSISKLGKQLTKAEQLGATYALILGDDELAKGTIIIKDLVNHSQGEVPIQDLGKELNI